LENHYDNKPRRTSDFFSSLFKKEKDYDFSKISIEDTLLNMNNELRVCID